jgi:hypothetical protein
MLIVDIGGIVHHQYYYRRAHVYVIYVCLSGVHIVLCFCFVLRLVYVDIFSSLDYPFLIAPFGLGISLLIWFKDKQILSH